MNPHEIPEPSADPATNARRLRWGLGFFLLVAAYFLLTEHRAHVVAVLPWLLLLSCPFMHLFMHRGHRSHHHDDGQRPDARGSGETKDQTHEGHEHGGHGCC
jgi:hypothetical protein